MSNGVLEAGRAVRPYLQQLVGPAAAGDVDSEVAKLLADDARGEDVTEQLRLVSTHEKARPCSLRTCSPTLRSFARHLQVVLAPPRHRGLEPLAGDVGPVLHAGRYACPQGDFVWYSPRVGTPSRPAPPMGQDSSPCKADAAMPGEFWKAASAKLADRLAAAAAPALVFWFGGLIAWIYDRGGTRQLEPAMDWLDKQTAPLQLIAIATVLAGVIASSLVVQRLTFPALRLLEGYWPAALGAVRQRLVDRETERASRDAAAWQELYLRVQPGTSPTARELADFARLDMALRRRPASPNRHMPTRIGNILKAAETWPDDKYGLDAVVIWPRLWLVLPETAREELAAARSALDSSVATSIWGLLFCAFAPWTLLAIPVGAGVAVVATIGWVPRRAAAFGDLVEAAYDLYRPALYKQLRWPLPTAPQHERASGEALTSYLWRGSRDGSPVLEDA